MNKTLHYLIMACYAIGLLTFSLSSIFRNHLSDFVLGFCNEISIVFTLVGVTYISWNIAKRKNPYKI